MTDIKLKSELWEQNCCRVDHRRILCIFLFLVSVSYVTHCVLSVPFWGPDKPFGGCNRWTLSGLTYPKMYCKRESERVPGTINDWCPSDSKLLDFNRRSCWNLQDVAYNIRRRSVGSAGCKSSTVGHAVASAAELLNWLQTWQPILLPLTVKLKKESLLLRQTQRIQDYV